MCLVSKALRTCQTTEFLKLAIAPRYLCVSYIKCLCKSTFASIPFKRKFYEAIFIKYCNNPFMNKFKLINAGKVFYRSTFSPFKTNFQLSLYMHKTFCYSQAYIKV